MSRLKRYAPNGWGQMVVDKPGLVWDEQPTDFYIRERDLEQELATLVATANVALARAGASHVIGFCDGVVVAVPARPIHDLMAEATVVSHEPGCGVWLDPPQACSCSPWITP